MTDETTTEQLAEIEGQAESTPTTEYTPPEGWRVLAVGEILQAGDMWVNHEGERRTRRVGETVNDERYIRRIEPQPEPEPQPQPNAATIEELRSEVSYVQNLLGTERRRVTQLEELVGSLRAINETQEKAFTAAGKENTALRNQLAAVKAELASVAADRQQLRVELDAAQQVPADSPELRQLWANLAEVAHDRDTYRHAHELLVQDVNATHQRTKAMTVEAICEWIEPIRREDPHLRAVILFHLPKIIRSLAGLNTPEDVD